MNPDNSGSPTPGVSARNRLRFMRSGGVISQSSWTLAALILLWLAGTAWMRPLLLPDEGRYVGVAWEMLQSGDWLTPTINGLPFFHKPPLFYWITAAALGAFGPHELPARLAPLLGATASALSLLWLTRRWSSPALVQSATGLLLCLPIFYVGAQFANLDMLVAGCISVTIAALAHAVLCAESGLTARKTLIVAWLGAALGVLAKGLIGFVLPALVLLLWLLMTRRLRLLGRLLWWPALLLFVAIAAPWFIAMQRRYPGFFDYFFVEQHVRRFAQGGFNNVQPVMFYPVVLLLLGLPWTLWAWRAAQRAWKGLNAPQALRALMFCWFAVVLVFFSLPQSKLIGYVLPAVPPMAWLLAEAVAASGLRWWRLCCGLGLALALFVIVGLSVTGRHSAKPIGLALRQAQLAAGPAAVAAPLIFIGEYLYDVPFYARNADAHLVIDQWDSPQVRLRDNWRKELADAGRFAPELAQQRLLRPEQLPQLLCAQASAWLVLPLNDAKRLALLAGLAPLVTADGSGLWRLERGAAIKARRLSCPGMPNAG